MPKLYSSIVPHAALLPCFYFFDVVLDLLVFMMSVLRFCLFVCLFRLISTDIKKTLCLQRQKKQEVKCNDVYLTNILHVLMKSRIKRM